MLSEQEKSRLTDLVAATAAAMGSPMPLESLVMIVSDLAGYPLGVIEKSLRKARTGASGRLTLKLILDGIVTEDGRPAREEAWSIALQALSEQDTVVWTREIMAAKAVANPLLAIGDKIGARMAFLEAYDRLIREAREAMRPAEWTVSEGFDRDLRLEAVKQAVRLGRVPAELVGQYLEHRPTGDGAAIAGLLTGKVAPDVSEENRKRFAELRKSLEANKPAPKQAAPDNTGELKRKAAEAVKAKLGEQ